jgi:NAD(P)H-hydrate epimerase
VLLGMIVAFLVQGLEAFEATVLGVFVHGAAGDRISARIGASGLRAGDLAAEVPATIASLRANAASPARVGITDRLAVSFPEP